MYSILTNNPINKARPESNSREQYTSWNQKTGIDLRSRGNCSIYKIIIYSYHIAFHLCWRSPWCLQFPNLARGILTSEKYKTWPTAAHRITQQTMTQYPYPYRGGGQEGTKPTCRIPVFLLGNPGIVIQPLEWNCKVTFLNKPWALVRKYLRLAPEELSASMITAAQFFGGMPSLHICCFSLTCA